MLDLIIRAGTTPMVAAETNANSSWPSWASETIALVDADPEWQYHGQRLRDTLDRLLAPWLTTHIEHVGSTAVPGLSRAPRLAASVGVQRSTCGVFRPCGGWFLALERSLASASRRSYVPENSSRSQSSVLQIEALLRSGFADREGRRVGEV